MTPSPTCVQKQCVQQLADDLPPLGQLKKVSSNDRTLSLSQALDMVQQSSPQGMIHWTRKTVRRGPRSPTVPQGDDVGGDESPRSVVTKQPVPVHRSVRFHERVQVRRVPYAREHVEDPGELWYQPAEFRQLRENAHGIMERVAQGMVGVGNRKFCTRGLEKLNKAYHSSGQRDNVYKLVLQLQNFQLEQGTVDPEAIASLYGSACDRAVQEAVSLAKLDEEAIKSYMKALRPCAS